MFGPRRHIKKPFGTALLIIVPIVAVLLAAEDGDATVRRARLLRLPQPALLRIIVIIDGGRVRTWVRRADRGS